LGLSDLPELNEVVSYSEQFTFYLFGDRVSVNQEGLNNIQEKTILCSKVVNSISFHVTQKLGVIYYSEEKEEKMRVIIGEKITQEDRQNLIENCKNNSDNYGLTYEKYLEVLSIIPAL